MKLSFNFEMGRSKTQERALNAETSIADKDAAINSRLPSLPGQPIDVHNSNQAMKLSAAYRCTSILSGTIASLPLIIKRKKDGYFSPDEENELHTILTRMPNRRMNSFEMVRNMVVQIVNQGNAYIVIRRRFGSVSELVLCANNTVTYDKLNDVYIISDPYNRIYGRFESYEIIHLKNNSLDGGYTGVSTIMYASRIFSIAASADNQNLRTFQNGSKIKGIVSGVKEINKGLPGAGMTDIQLSTVGDRIEEQLNTGRDIISVPGDVGFHQLSINPVDAQLLETKKFSILDICRFYGVHPDKVFAGQSPNYKASEMSNVSFLTDTLRPILKQIEAEFNYKLIPNSVAHLYKISFDLACLYQTDLTTQAIYLKTMEEAGIFSINEARKQVDQPPVEGGDKVFISCNVQPIEAASQKVELPKNEEANI